MSDKFDRQEVESMNSGEWGDSEVLPDGEEYTGAQDVAGEKASRPASPEALELLADFVKHAKDGGTVMGWIREQ